MRQLYGKQVYGITAASIDRKTETETETEYQYILAKHKLFRKNLIRENFDSSAAVRWHTVMS